MDIQAYKYLVSGSIRTYSRRDFLRAVRAERKESFMPELPYMVYIGEGYVPLQIAVLARTADAALGCAYDYLSEHKPAEVQDDDICMQVVAISDSEIDAAYSQYK